MRYFLTALSVLVFNAFAFCQGNNKAVFNVGLLVMEVPSVDVGIQYKHYAISDSALFNSGLGVGCEFNFGINSSKVTIGPKLYYQFDKHILDFGVHRTSVFIVGKLSIIDYINSGDNELRIAPEAGLSLYDAVSILYGYNFGYNNHLPQATGSRIALILTFGGKEGHKVESAPLKELH